MNGISSLPFSHPHLNETRKAKSQFKNDIQQNINSETNNFIKLEREALKKCSRLHLYDTILRQAPKVLPLNSTEAYDRGILVSTRDFDLNGNWK